MGSRCCDRKSLRPCSLHPAHTLPNSAIRMKLTGFDIKTFKGIKDAKIRFDFDDIARVHTLVGLNESGKTTLLEAIHSFSPDFETQLVVRNAKTVQEQREQAVPRDKIASFTGEVSIAANVIASPDDWRHLRDELLTDHELVLEETSLPDAFTLRLVHTYKNGDYQRTCRNIDIKSLKIRRKRQKHFRSPDLEELNVFGRLIRARLPTVAYYPTFVFDFPKRIYLTDRDKGPRNQFYRRLFQDILDYDGSGYTIEDSIVSRLHRTENQAHWEKWFPTFVGTSEEDKVKQVIARAERAVTKLVFSKWNEVFGENAGAKEISIELQYERGKNVQLEDGTEEGASVHDAYIRFRIKDGPNIFSVDDRSLGFRWFFSFLLFTQFRIHRENHRATIFLFDEPASNLHAAAQKKLLESFPAIAKAPHRLFYSTHSHYMVEPKWLEQAYIVFDRLSSPDESIIDASTQSDSTVDVKVVPYRQFVQERPSQTSYFQPILDTLEVKPSSFDYRLGGLIVEGKSDFYFVRFASMITGVDLGPIFPAYGSGTMGSLVALHRGWGLPVRILFDSDRGGKDGQKKLKRELALSDCEYIELSSICGSTKTIEGLFSESDIDHLVSFGGINRKTALLRRVQELLAANEHPKLDKTTMKNMEAISNALKIFCDAAR